MRQKRTEKELLDALEKLFLANGFSAMPMSQIAASLSCSYRRLYQISDNKSALFEAVLTRLLQRIICEAEAAIATKSTLRERVAAYLEPGLRALRDASPDFFDDIENLPNARALLDRHQARRIERLSELLEDSGSSLRHAGVDPQYLSRMTFEIVKIARNKEVQDRSGMSFEEWHAGLYKVLDLLLSNYAENKL